MAKLVDRVVETTQTTGTGTLDLGGAQTGYRAFSDELTSGDTVYYCIEDDPSAPTEYEYGIGTWTSGSPATLSRDTVIGSSNGGSKISLQAGTTYTVVGVLVKAALGTAAAKDTGTSGNTVPLLDGANTWSAAQNFPGSTAINSAGALAIGGGGAIKKLTQTTVSLNFPSIASGAKADLTATVTGAVVGDIALVSFGQATRSSDLWYDAWVSAADTVTVRAFNRTGGAIDASTDIFRVVVIGF